MATEMFTHDSIFTRVWKIVLSRDRVFERKLIRMKIFFFFLIDIYLPLEDREVMELFFFKLRLIGI